MLSPHVAETLVRIEKQCDAVTAAAMNGNPTALQTASLALRQAAVDFSGLLEGAALPVALTRKLRLRLKRLAGEIAGQRECLVRRSVVVERALHAMVPATQNTTYAAATKPYAGTVRQTGAFKMLSA